MTHTCLAFLWSSDTDLSALQRIRSPELSADAEGKKNSYFLLLYVRFSKSVGEAGGRKEVSTHTNTMVWFPYASPQDAVKIHTQTNSEQWIDTWCFHFIYCCWLFFCLKKKKSDVIYSLTSPAAPAFKLIMKCRLHLPIKTGQGMKNK